jgi:hypothetical protein
MASYARIAAARKDIVMDDAFPLAVLLVSLLIGAGGIVFMFTQKIVVNEQNNKTEIDVPFFGKLQTNYPAIAAFFLAAVLAAYTTSIWKEDLKRIPVTATVTLEPGEWPNSPQVLVGVIPGSALRLETVNNRGKSYEFEIPVLAGEFSYTGIAQVRAPGLAELAMGTFIPDTNGRLRFKAVLRGDQRSGPDLLEKK